MEQLLEFLGLAGKECVMKNHKVCSEEEVFEHVNNDEYSVDKGAEVHFPYAPRYS
jgi:hypothetical protein